MKKVSISLAILAVLTMLAAAPSAPARTQCQTNNQIWIWSDFPPNHPVEMPAHFWWDPSSDAGCVTAPVGVQRNTNWISPYASKIQVVMINYPRSPAYPPKDSTITFGRKTYPLYFSWDAAAKRWRSTVYFRQPGTIVVKSYLLEPGDSRRSFFRSVWRWSPAETTAL